MRSAARVPAGTVPSRIGAIVALLCASCGSSKSAEVPPGAGGPDSSAAPGANTTPVATPLRAVSVVGGGADILDPPFASMLDSADELHAVLDGQMTPSEVESIEVDWDSEAALVIATEASSCPPILADLERDGPRLTPVFANAGYEECPAIITFQTVIAAVDRSVLSGADELYLSADRSGGTADLVTPIDVSGPRGPREARPVAVELGDARGVTDLPDRSAVTASLFDGTPVFVIRHDDGSLSAVDPRGAVESGDVRRLAEWSPGTRRLLVGGAAWDEYGRRLNGSRSTDLQTFATAVRADTVTIGQPVPPPAGSPVVTSGAADSERVAVSVGPVRSVEETEALPVGATAWIDAALVVSDGAAFVCVDPHSDSSIPPESTIPRATACPEGSPRVDGVELRGRSTAVFLGPLLATKTATGFERLAYTGGVVSTQG